jgi:hypothetical protein
LELCSEAEKVFSKDSLDANSFSNIFRLNYRISGG